MAEKLMKDYGVEYAVIGRSELRDFGASDGYFRRHHRLLLEQAGYAVFEIDDSAIGADAGEAGRERK